MVQNGLRGVFFDEVMASQKNLVCLIGVFRIWILIFRHELNCNFSCLL